MVNTRAGTLRDAVNNTHPMDGSEVSSVSDLMKLKVVELRGLLRENNIPIPPKAKKVDLIEVCQENSIFSVRPDNQQAACTTSETHDAQVDSIADQIEVLDLEGNRQLDTLGKTSNMSTDSPTDLKESDSENTEPRPLEPIPSQFDDVSYLQPGFRPSSLKAAMIRNILCRHSIPYTGTENKAQLVRMFNEHVQPRAASTLVAIQKVVRSDDGIVNKE
ncbi:hypothetical protein CkaCkLH20_12244 [Colletotrichum karsti]|uniref:HeH/LEM domain-containing protein n=1 Tax=Colletotrichum karsti TaxID=1095194 RepID=A0A9P6I1P3_9PEZI|nr:uncharacterized protein CkaCkLH20_12244 [Colletotrichum karsti]KAF9870280.1 hypothetical protein CkaCkLH20_12244 [Colletotrichum karsti]